MKPCAVLLFGAAVACAQPAQPSVDEVVAKYVKAIGGRAALEKLTTRVSKGKIELPALNATGSFEQYAKAPSKVINITTIEGYGVVKQAFDGKAGWAQDPERGLRDLSGEELERTQRGANFYRALKLKETYSNLAVKGKEKVGEREVWVLEGTPSGGPAEKLSFDTETGLLLKAEGGSTSTRFEDYKDVDGIRLAHTIRQETPQFSFTITLTEIRHNAPVDDSQFKKPAQ